MSNVLRLAMVDPNDGTREKLKAMLLTIETVWLEADCSRYEFFPDVIAQTNPDVGVLALDADPNKTVSLVERLTKEHPDCVLLVVSGSNDGQLILRAIRAGALQISRVKCRFQFFLGQWQRQEFTRSGADGAKDQLSIVAAADDQQHTIRMLFGQPFN